MRRLRGLGLLNIYSLLVLLFMFSGHVLICLFVDLLIWRLVYLSVCWFIAL